MNKNKFVTIEYNSSNKKKLSVNIFKPLDWCSNQYRSGIILFHGGGFKIGSPERFYNQSLYFASKGYVVFVPEYRTQSKDNTGPYEATYDGHYFYNWLTKKSRQFGVDKNKLILGGASAGAQIAASIANKNIFESQNTIKPLALILYNPAINISPKGKKRDQFFRDFFIDPAKECLNNFPPCIILHGTSDDIIPIDWVSEFARNLEGLGRDVVFKEFLNRGHGFFNINKKDKDYKNCNEYIEFFLKKRGF